MTMTTRVQSVSIPVADQDRALEFYTKVLGCELRTDIEVWPGARLVEVVPPGSRVGLVLLPPDSEIPMAVRLGTTSAETAYARLRQAGVTLHNDEVVHLDGAPPMFFFADRTATGSCTWRKSLPDSVGSYQAKWRMVAGSAGWYGGH
jgi:catechol 2,3-dioxygenase-like lactoylglutathione lyase family enzyme